MFSIQITKDETHYHFLAFWNGSPVDYEKIDKHEWFEMVNYLGIRSYQEVQDRFKEVCEYFINKK
jgi:hypothetical protein